MRRGLVLAFLGPVAGCVVGAAPLETQTFSTRNPTYHEFDLPLELLRAEVIAALSSQRQHDSPIFGRVEDWSPRSLQVREAGQDASSAKVLTLPGNERDLYLTSDHEPLWRSPVYRGAGTGLPFLAEFHLHFAPVSSTRTGLTVAALKTEVINGGTVGVGMCGPGTFNRYVPVEPTSIEEFLILRYVGDYLGLVSMPEVVLPAP